MNAMLGTCKLCLTPGVKLQMSHYMPAALYPKNIKLEYLSRGGVRTVVADNEIKMPLLCFECEQRFSAQGESEVLRHIAGKIANKPSPLLAKLSPLTVQEEDGTLKSYCGGDAGLNMDMFAYFALSMAWRSTISWPVDGEDDTKPQRGSRSAGQWLCLRVRWPRVKNTRVETVAARSDTFEVPLETTSPKEPEPCHRLS